MFADVNYPNPLQAATAEDLVAPGHAPGDGSVEFCNGHSGVRNDGDAFHPSTERMGDMVFAKGIAERGARARYEARGDESYVRSRVTSSRLHRNPFAEGGPGDGVDAAAGGRPGGHWPVTFRKDIRNAGESSRSSSPC